MANENMIQKHEDNFLAKIAGGATPVDTNVRNSKEFWLDKIADWTGGKSTDDASTKKIYWHTIYFKRATEGYAYRDGFVIVLNNTATPIDADAFIELLKTPGFFAVVMNGRSGGGINGDETTDDVVAIQYRSATTFTIFTRSDATKELVSAASDLFFLTVTDYGANAIN